MKNVNSYRHRSYKKLNTLFSEVMSRERMSVCYAPALEGAQPLSVEWSERDTLTVSLMANARQERLISLIVDDENETVKLCRYENKLTGEWWSIQYLTDEVCDTQTEVLRPEHSSGMVLEFLATSPYRLDIDRFVIECIRSLEVCGYEPERE